MECQSVGPPPAKERQVPKLNDKMADRMREALFKLEQVCGWKLGPQIFIRILFGPNKRTLRTSHVV